VPEPQSGNTAYVYKAHIGDEDKQNRKAGSGIAPLWQRRPGLRKQGQSDRLKLQGFRSI